MKKRWMRTIIAGCLCLGMTWNGMPKYIFAEDAAPNISMEMVRAYEVSEGVKIHDSVILKDGSTVMVGEKEGGTYIAKYDNQGELLRGQKPFGKGYLDRMLLLSDGDILVSGVVYIGTNGIKNAYISKIDSNGAMIWEKILAGTSFFSPEKNQRVRGTSCQFVDCMYEVKPSVYAVALTGLWSDATLFVYNENGYEIFKKEYLWQSKDDFFGIDSIVSDKKGNIWIRLTGSHKNYPDIEVIDQWGETVQEIKSADLPSYIFKVDGKNIYGYTTKTEQRSGNIVKYRLDEKGNITIEKSIPFDGDKVTDSFTTVDGSFVLAGYNQFLRGNITMFDKDLNLKVTGYANDISMDFFALDKSRMRILRDGTLELRGSYSDKGYYRVAAMNIAKYMDEPVYDILDLMEEINLPVDLLNYYVTDVPSAVEVTEETVRGMTDEQKQTPTGIDLATLSAETAVARAAAKPIYDNEIVINKASVSDLQAVAVEASTEVENTLVNGGIMPERTFSKTVTLTSDSMDELSIRIEPDILTSGVDKVRVETPSCALTFKISDLEADLTKPLTVTLQELGSDTENAPADTTMAMVAGVRNFAEGYKTVDMGISDISPLANPVKKVKVNFPGGKMTNAVTVSLPSGGGDKTYQAVVKDDGKATASKYNPATTAIDGKVNTSGTYSVQTNQKNFSDIASKSAEMQKAIRYLASKGIINGTTETTFSPDQTISRAQIASLMVQTLGKMDNSATANFKDVPKNAWYYHQAASSQKHGLFSGYEDNTFRGGNAIQKDQLVNVTGNVLVKEMGYKAPGNPSAYLSKYSDNVAGWAQPMVALATKENLVVYRTNGTFGGKGTMTRGDAAIIIYRLFMKIW